MMPFTLPFSDPVLIFGTVMVIILLAPIAARKGALPEIIGLIFAGIAVGPHGLGLLERGESIELLGKVGLLYIMFLAGLEIDLHQVRKNRSHTLIFGLITFLIPLIMGTFLGYAVFGMTIPVSVLLASMFSSHTLLTFPAAGKLGLTKNRSVTTAVGGTIITDTLALIVLAVIVGTSRGEITLFFWVKLFSLMVIYMAATLFFLPKIGRWVFNRTGSDEEQEYVFVMALTFGVSYLAHLAGLEPIIGAFLAGLSLNSLIPERSILMTRIHFIGNAIFIPFFLVSVGMLVNFRLLVSGIDVWIVIGGMTAVALASKYFAARISSWILRYRSSEAHLVYGLSVNQAAATLAAVLVGYNIGLFNTAVITGTIMMIAVTSLVGSIVTQKAGRKVALEEEKAEYDETAAPHRILIPLEGRKGAKELLDLSILLRKEGSREPVYPLRVSCESMQIEKDIADAEKILAHSVVRAMSANIPVTPLTLVDLNEASGIIRAARDNRISLISFLWDGKQKAGSRAFGHTLDEVIDRTHQMVLINKLSYPAGVSKRVIVLIPPFGHRQPGFENAIGLVKNLSSQIGSDMKVLASSEVLEASRGFITAMEPKVPLDFDAVPVWKRVCEQLEQIVREGDWILLLSSRKGDISWQPIMERLPSNIVESVPSNNFSAVYPPSRRWDSNLAAETITVKHRLISGFTPERCVFNMDASTVLEAVTILLSKYFGKSTANTKTISSILHTISQEEPVELAKDVILLHTHLPLVTEPLIFMGVNSRALDVPLATEAPHVIIILLDPLDQDPAVHLKNLADIARLIRIPQMVSDLRKVRNYDSFIRIVEQRIDEGNTGFSG
jgi:Kef-type K+ transport system membrane component KefB/mannitol/fructose-specific phosphotransferase system IIA component (Ntr-type)